MENLHASERVEHCIAKWGHLVVENMNRDLLHLMVMWGELLHH